ncbi:hypothetical protein CMI41_01460 [Candidatus Pacearchaeota archaeon]|nr:hypothetical protein [Candidatus Pacearchaeota archaeon]
MVGKVKSLLRILGVAGVLTAPPAVAETNAVVGPLTNNVNITWNWDIESNQQIGSGAGGSVSGTAGGWYRVGSTISNNAVANEHYDFSSWSGDVPAGKEGDNPLVYVSDRTPRNITADFGLKQYAVTVNSEVDGLTDVGNPTGAGDYDAFSVITSTVPDVVVNSTNAGIRYIPVSHDTD